MRILGLKCIPVADGIFWPDENRGFTNVNEYRSPNSSSFRANLETNTFKDATVANTLNTRLPDRFSVTKVKIKVRITSRFSIISYKPAGYRLRCYGYDISIPAHLSGVLRVVRRAYLRSVHREKGFARKHRRCSNVKGTFTAKLW